MPKDKSRPKVDAPPPSPHEPRCLTPKEFSDLQERLSTDNLAALIYNFLMNSDPDYMETPEYTPRSFDLRTKVIGIYLQTEIELGHPTDFASLHDFLNDVRWVLGPLLGTISDRELLIASCHEERGGARIPEWKVAEL